MENQRFGTYRNSVIVKDALRFAPARLNLAAGLRAGLSVTGPLLLAPLLPQPELAFAGVAGFGIVMADKGGAYATRARAMLVMALTGALVTLLGTSLGAQPLPATALVLVLVSLAGFVRLLGAEATSIGTLSAVALVVALARPAAEPQGVLASVAFSVLGSAWAALLSLVVWPLRMYRPSRLAVASALRELSLVAESFIGAAGDLRAQAGRRAQLGHAREQLEAARGALGSSRRSRPGPSRRGEQLVALLESADQLFAALVALEDGLALEPDRLAGDEPSALSSPLVKLVDQLASLVASELTRCAAALVAEQPLADSLTADALRQELEQLAAESETDHVPRIMLRALERLMRTSELVRVVDDPKRSERPGRAQPSDLSSRASRRSLLVDNLTLQSAMFRHALRTGITTAFVFGAMHALQLEHGYWATLTCLVIMQPHGAATWAKALQRVVGTVIGACLAVLVASFVHEPRLMLGCVFVFVASAMAVLPLNYGAFAVFLTPGFVLLAETHAGHHGLASARIVNTLLGAFVALLGSRLLFPLSERDQFRPLLAEALRAARDLLEVASASVPSPVRLGEARRDVGLALLNAEASYQRLLTEAGIEPEESEALLSLLLFTHRLASGMIALAVAEGSPAHLELMERTPELWRTLDGLREVVLGKTLPGVAVASPYGKPAPHGLARGERVDTLFEQLEVLRESIERWNLRRGNVPLAPRS